MPDDTIEIVSATRLTAEEFLAKAPLAASLDRLKFDARLRPRIFPQNATGLPTLYNRVIDDVGDASDILVFVHDDIWFDDVFVADRVLDGLRTYDVIGVAGTRRRQPQQTKWLLDPATGKRDEGQLSGAVSHVRPFGKVTAYGPAPAACELMDGLFLATRRSTLRRAGVRFDPQFDFHFYDLDLCRSARLAGLTLGTWPISLTHRSIGVFTSAAWEAMSQRYLAKWPD